MLLHLRVQLLGFESSNASVNYYCGGVVGLGFEVQAAHRTNFMHYLSSPCHDRADVLAKRGPGAPRHEQSL